MKQMRHIPWEPKAEPARVPVWVALGMLALTVLMSGIVVAQFINTHHTAP